MHYHASSVSYKICNPVRQPFLQAYDGLKKGSFLLIQVICSFISLLLGKSYFWTHAEIIHSYPMTCSKFFVSACLPTSLHYVPPMLKAVFSSRFLVGSWAQIVKLHQLTFIIA